MARPSVTSAPGLPAADLPFDAAHLDRLLEKAKIDVVLVTSKHNIQYLLGGYRFFFFDYSDAIGVSRYLPILIYPAGRPEKAVYIGNAMESSELENKRFWCSTVETKSWGTLDATGLAIEHLRQLGLPTSTIGIEFAFMPADAADTLRAAMPNSSVVEAHLPLERLRARKTPGELDLIRIASQQVVDSMLAVFASNVSGRSKRDIAAHLRQEEIGRDLVFEYCLISAGASHNRAPSEQIIQDGDVVALDSGGRYRGYIGDLCRMGVAGRPDSELNDLLAEIESIQQVARGPIRSGVRGGDIFAAAEAVLAKSPHRRLMHFVAHGMGIIGHEAPRLSSRGPVTYGAYDVDLPLEDGMVLSVETTMLHPQRGLLKLEDTLAVTATGYDAFGDHGRGWNVAD
jgi:Xaa-Pro aminopeptidase